MTEDKDKLAKEQRVGNHKNIFQTLNTAPQNPQNLQKEKEIYYIDTYVAHRQG